MLIIQSTFAFVNINTGKDYTIKEVKKMDRFELQNFVAQNVGQKKVGTKEQIASGQAELARRIVLSQS